MKWILLILITFSSFAQDAQYRDVFEVLDEKLKPTIILKPKTKIEFELLIEELKESDIEFDISGGGGGGPGLTNDSVFSLESNQVK